MLGPCVVPMCHATSSLDRSLFIDIIRLDQPDSNSFHLGIWVARLESTHLSLTLWNLANLGHPTWVSSLELDSLTLSHFSAFIHSTLGIDICNLSIRLGLSQLRPSHHHIIGVIPMEVYNEWPPCGRTHFY